MAQHIERSHEVPDHLYLEASIQGARSETGFKVSILRGSLRFRLSRSYSAQQIVVEMIGFKSVRVVDKGGVNMNSGVDVSDVSERLCCITWNLEDDVELVGGRQYVYPFSALLDARLPRSIKAKTSKVYYRMSADIPKLRSLRTESRLNIPWSRTAMFATEADETDSGEEVVTIPIEQDGDVTLTLPRTIIKGPDRSMRLQLYPNRPPAELHLTHVTIELLQDVTMYLQRLKEPHTEPSNVIFSHKSDLTPSCSATLPLQILIPLPAEIHAYMQNPHISVSHILKVTIHRAGLRRSKTHRQKVVLHHVNVDHPDGHELPMYEQVMTRENNDPVYEYSSVDRKVADDSHIML